MKFNKISMVLAALAFVGCSSEDLNEFSATPAVEDSNLIQLGSDFVLAGVGADGTTTRTHWEWEDATTKEKLVNKFLPIWATDPGTGTIADFADLQAQAVGLCWLGNGAVGTDVYTNYEFYHYGWLKKKETTAKFDDCGYLTNGLLYNDINAGSGNAGEEADPTAFTRVSTRPVIPGTTAPAYSVNIGDLNYNTGIYKTDNKAIFGGQYIVYYPYNANFKDAGTIPATAKTSWENVSEAFNTKEIGKETFRYSAPVRIEGGNQAADFGLYNLSSLVQLRVATPANVDLSSKSIDQIVLYSASKKLLKQANLAADQIAAGKEGADLYTSTEGTKTISAKFAAPVTLQKTNSTSPAPTSAYITVLPTTVDDLVVLVHRTDGKWASIQKSNTVFEAGKAKRLDVSVTDDDFKADYIAVDQASLQQALDEARTAIGTTSAKKTITVIGDITLTSNLDINFTKDTQITIKGDDIIVPEDKNLYLKTNMESNVRVLGKSCCSGTNGGRLVVQGGTISNVTLEETEASSKTATTNPKLTYEAADASVASTAIVAAGKTVDVQAGEVVVNMAVQHKGDIKIAEGVNVTVNGKATNNTGELNFMGSTVTNDGTIEVKKDGKFDMTAKNGGATATDGKRMTNNGTFIHNIDAGVGTAVQSMNQNGEYRCRVNEQTKLDDAYQQWTACSVIEMVNSGDVNYNLGIAESNINYQHNGKYIDIEVNADGATTFDNPDLDNKEIKIGKLTVTKGDLTIDFVKANGNDATATGYKIGKRTLTVNGDMTVAANGYTTTIKDSKKVNITGKLTVNKATLKYCGPNTPTSPAETKQNNEEGLAVTKDIIVNGNGSKFDAGDVDALNITCANFTLKSNGKASFGNRTDGAAKNMVVSGTIANPSGCEFDIIAAGQSGGSVLAWVSCKELTVGGTFTGARPRVVE